MRTSRFLAASIVALSACARAGAHDVALSSAPVPSLVATELAPGVLSHGHTFAATFTASGDTVFTVERTYAAGSTTPRLVVQTSVRRADGSWAPLVAAPFSGRWRDIDPYLAPDGSRLWFNSARPRAAGDTAPTQFDIWYVDRRGNGWGEPVLLPAPITTNASEYFATVTRSGTLYYSTSRSGNEQVVVRSRPTGGGWSPPDTIAFPGNVVRGPNNPLVAPDESWLVFVADGEGAYGDADLWIAFRDGNGWTTPRNLGPAVNTGLAEFAPGLGPGGRTLVFTRMRRGEGRIPIEERLFSIDLPALLRELRPR
jgi:Tol biopolymer transport system component